MMHGRCRSVKFDFHLCSCTNCDQSQLLPDATLLGIILSSDKTNIFVLTGDHVTHPLLISIANIKMATCLKLSLHAFLLTALLPVPKFLYQKKRMKGMLKDHLIHQCLDIVLEPLNDYCWCHAI